MSLPRPTEKQARILWNSVTALAVAVLVGLIGLLVWGLGLVLKLLSSVLLPLAIAGILAYLLDPVVDFIESKKVPRRRAILHVFFLACMLVLILLATVVPRLVVETEELIIRVPEYSRQAQKILSTWTTQSPLGRRVKSAWQSQIQPTNQVAAATNITAQSTNALPPVPTSIPPGELWETRLFEKFWEWLAKILPLLGSWLLVQLNRVASWLGLLVGLVLIPVYLFYFLLEKKGIEKSWTDYLPLRESTVKEELVFVLKAINESLIVFFRGQVLVALCLGALLTLGFFMIGLNYALLLGLMAGLLSIVPYLGVTISLLPALALAAVQFQDWLHPILVLVVFALVQMAEGLVISPKIIGDRVRLHPLAVIVAVLVGATLMGGIIGGVLAIPLTAALRVVMFRYVWKKRAQQA